MTIRSRLIGPCVIETQDPAEPAFDAAAFIHRLFLFDCYVLQSVHFRELPDLVRMFGASGVRTLLQVGALRAQCDAVSVGQMGQTDLFRTTKKRGPLPLNSFSLGIVRAHDQRRLVSAALKNVDRAFGDRKEIIKLKRALVDSLEQPPPGFGAEALRSVPGDLQNHELLRSAIAGAAARTRGANLANSVIEARAIQLDADDFRLESNVGDLLHLDEGDTHRVLEQAALAIGGLNFRLEQMKVHKALSGATDDDTSIFEHKLGIIAHDCDPERAQEEFRRVIAIRDFPAIDAQSTRIDVDAFLKARSSPELREFRAWLQTAHTLADDEVRERIASVSARIKAHFHSTPGRALRFLATTAIGLHPSYGVAVGTAASAIDAFVVDKVFGVSGPALFLNHTYPSIFKKR